MKGIKTVEQALDIFSYIANIKSNLHSFETYSHIPTGKYLSNYVVHVVVNIAEKIYITITLHTLTKSTLHLTFNYISISKSAEPYCPNRMIINL
ncbi:unnamed protein product [Rhizophagus irregularis]|uniref:Uncharacterized protein n=1 Tax=Rhizophagus irregularis TaxID=588596 RepID=A0A915YZ99_9GLOM|nr:unnamed protein product [Rhizophagus irregularis]CAB5216463.1 unnamed protein product [Rhizophagus irregularis]CAB5356019.1 unnamed protein product [Rhizophagus irregularis]